MANKETSPVVVFKNKTMGIGAGFKAGLGRLKKPPILLAFILVLAGAAYSVYYYRFSAHKAKSIGEVTQNVNTLLENKKPDEAKAEIETYLATDPSAADKAKAEIYLSNVYNQKGDKSATIDWLAKGIADSPSSNSNSYMNLAQLEEANGDKAAALKHYKKSRELIQTVDIFGRAAVQNFLDQKIQMLETGQ